MQLEGRGRRGVKVELFDSKDADGHDDYDDEDGDDYGDDDSSFCSLWKTKTNYTYSGLNRKFCARFRRFLRDRKNVQNSNFFSLR